MSVPMTLPAGDDGLLKFTTGSPFLRIRSGMPFGRPVARDRPVVRGVGRVLHERTGVLVIGVIGEPEATAKHHLTRQRCREPESRRDVRKIGIDAGRSAHAINAGDEQLPFRRNPVREAIVLLGERREDIVTKPQVHGEPRGRAPVILHEDARLVRMVVRHPRRIQPAHVCRIPEEERREGVAPAC